MLKENILETIGDTPLIRLSRLEKKLNVEGELYAKLEYYSPGFSKKDRIAKYMLEIAIKEGKLKPGQTVIEKTSGNTGIALAAACSILGYPFVAVMSSGNSKERIRMIEDFGGKVVLVPQDQTSEKNKVNNKDLELVEREYRKLIKELDAFAIDQFENENNPDTHYLYTGKEIIDDLPEVDAFVDYVGTGGSFVGISRRLKEHAPSVKCCIVVPDKQNHIIQGGGYFKEIPFLNEDLLDDTIVVSEQDALMGMEYLARYEAISSGISTGANVMAAIKFLKENKNKKVVFLVNDISLKYNSIIEAKKLM